MKKQRNAGETIQRALNWWKFSWKCTRNSKLYSRNRTKYLHASIILYGDSWNTYIIYNKEHKENIRVYAPVISMRTDRYFCTWPECGQSYSKPSKLSEHFRSHTNEVRKERFIKFIINPCLEMFCLRIWRMWEEFLEEGAPSTTPIVCSLEGKKFRVFSRGLWSCLRIETSLNASWKITRNGETFWVHVAWLQCRLH